MTCLTNYTVQCLDVTSGKIGCFLFDERHWIVTGEFLAVSPIHEDLHSFFRNTDPEKRKSIYIDRRA